MKKILLAIYCGALCSCGSTSAPTPPPSTTEAAVSGFSIYLSRSSLHSSDFEQHKIAGGKIFSECGRLHYGRTEPISNTLISLSAEDYSQLLSLASVVANDYSNRKPSLSEAGNSKSLFDPGEVTANFEVSGRTIEVKTSLDSVANAEKPFLKKLLELTEQTRGKVSPAKLCEQSVFYKIARR